MAALAVQFGIELPFGRASGLLAAATGVTISPATIRRLTEEAGAVWRQLELTLVQELEATTLDPAFPQITVPDADPIAVDAVVQLSLDGAMVPLVDGEWAEVRTLAVGQVDRTPTGVTTTALSYASQLSDAARFGRDILGELSRRGVIGHPAVVAVCDGARWIQEVLDLQCPHAVRILDFPHAAGYLAQAAQASFGPGAEATSAWFATMHHELRHGDVATVLAAVSALPPSGERDTALGYLGRRQAMLTYPVWDAAGYPVGSGCIESANKIVVEARLKGAGMHWSRPHADALVGLRALVASGRWATAWSRIVGALRTERRIRTAQRRRARANANHIPSPNRPLPDKLIVNGKPTSAHPWKRFPACPGGIATSHSATKM